MSQNKKTKLNENNMSKIFIAVFVGIIAILLAVVIIMIAAKSGGSEGTGDGEKTDPAPDQSTHPIVTEPLIDDVNIPELKIESIEEQSENTVIKTSYCTITFPSMFYDLIKVDEYFGDGTGCIIFSAYIGNGYETVYTLIFNSETGIDIGTLKLDGVDDPIRVSVNFYEPSEGLSDDALAGFYAAQETFNDVVVSLEKNEGFTSSN